MDRIEQVLLGIVGLLVVLTAVAMWALWPTERFVPDPEDAPPPLYNGRVLAAEDYPCPEQDGPFGFEMTEPCQVIEIEIRDGPAEGTVFTLDTGVEDYPEMSAGDRVRVGIAEGPDGQPLFFVGDFGRGAPLLVLLLLFVAIVVAIGRWHGLRSLVGLLLSLLIITVFIVPAILDGRSPFVVAVVGAFAIMVITLYLAHGFSVKTTSALVGTAAALGFTALLGLVFVTVSQLTGLSSEEARFVRFAMAEIDLRGLILAGLVIGALGVLDDVTVSQASTVFAVHGANPQQSFAEVFRRAMDVGRDHIASVVNTLVLAYVGAALPLIVLFTTTGEPFGEVITMEIVAEEVVRTLVGSIGLVAAVPFTTALATAVAIRRERREPPVPAHLAEDAELDQLSDDELAHRRWVEFLREDQTEDDTPPLPGEDEV